MRIGVIIRELSHGLVEVVTPSLPGCITRGPNRKKALDKHREQVRMYVAAASDTLPDEVSLYVVHESGTGSTMPFRLPNQSSSTKMPGKEV